MQRLRHILLLATALMPLGLVPASAGPVGGTVVGGSAAIQNPGSANVTINQFSQNAIINWHTFNIGAGERTTFNQPNSSSTALNRVTGGTGPSEILGRLDANGRVFIINRDGFVFGAGAVINTSGFLATTSDIRNEDFMAGRYNFQIPGRPDASIVNMGTITANNGGFAALVAPGVRNSGTITATLGTVGLAAANTFNLDFYGDRLIKLDVNDQIAGQVRDVATGQTLRALVTNEGKLKANGGRVELTAAAARQVVDSVINTSGVIEANSVGTRGGQIVLGAASASTKGALPTQTVRVSGKLSAAGRKAGTKGGTIVVTGENIEVAGATINASGVEGGGKVMIGGDWGGGNPDKSLVSNQSARLESYLIPTAKTVSIDAATRIDASATTRGDGGKVVVWSDGLTSFAGTILALGGTQFGNGGFVETSGHTVNITGSVNAGKGGTWLLDPDDLTINPSLAASISSSLNGGSNVTQSTSSFGTGGVGDITVNGVINWSTSATLTLSAYRNIVINDTGVNGTIKNTGAGHLVLHANNEGAFTVGSGNGVISMPPSTFQNRVDWTGSTGTVTVYYNPSAYTSPTNFTTNISSGNFVLASPSQLTTYMLVNNVTDLANIGTNGTTLGFNYALSKDIDASSNPNFTPLGTFNGIFDGLNHTISNLTIAPITPSTVGIGVGLFTATGFTSVVRNVNFDNANVTANPNVTGPGQFVGILAGTNTGLISNVTITNSTVSHGTANQGVILGGLVGQNGDLGPNGHLGTINLAIVEATVSVGSSPTGSSGNSAGGIAGNNPGTIANSFASGDVTGGKNSTIGGLVGRNENTASINLSGATGNVTLTGDGFGSTAGGLVGFNFGQINTSVAGGTVTGSSSSDVFHAANIGGLAGMQNTGASIVTSFATGNVIAGNNNSAGGFIGSNNGGSITGSGAGGEVSGGNNIAGGFVGFNTGAITSSVAVGAVNGSGFSLGGFVGANANGGTITVSGAIGNVTNTGTDASAGGFAGSNQGTISASQSFGNVTSGDHTNSGGFAGNNQGTISASQSFGNVTSGNNSGSGGFVGGNQGSIDNSLALGNVTVGNNAVAGGFAGENHGSITASVANGSVTGGADTALGGFVGLNRNSGVIADSTAFGGASATGANSIVGGFAGVNTGKLTNVSSSGPVSGTSDSFLGGLVGINIGVAQDSHSTSTVTGSGANNIAGGFAGVNFGSIDPSTSGGDVSSGPNSIVGGFVGANAAIRFPDGFQLIGTISPDSTATGNASGGAGSTVGPQVGQSFPTSGFPSIPQGACDGNPLCGGTLFNPGGQVPNQPDQPNQPDRRPDIITSTSPQTVVAQNLTLDTSLNPTTPPTLITTTPNNPVGGQQKGGNNSGASGGRPPANSVPPPGLGPLPSGMPPLTETRFPNNEVVMQLGLELSDERLAKFMRDFGLEIITDQRFDLLGRRVLRFRITSGKPVRDVIGRGEQQIGSKISLQPSYFFELTQPATAPADAAASSTSEQYVVAKLNLPQAHLIATGKDVKVAVIDSEIDAKHPDLQGVIADNFDALPSSDQTPHPHGTGMAGAIASHQRLLGIAPAAKLLAIRAFGVTNDGAQGTSLNIVKGLQWAVDQGARIINMSFAGPRDPILQQAMKKLSDDGIILIAAAGNAGPKSPPLYPGADPSVIAVSATDVDDKVYKGANRGKYLAVAAPGVDILVPAPDGGYQLTTGTSVAAAEISGVVALLLERNKTLKPSEVRSILTSTAKNVGLPKTDVGAGLVDPVAALAKGAPKSAMR